MISSLMETDVYPPPDLISIVAPGIMESLSSELHAKSTKNGVPNKSTDIPLSANNSNHRTAILSRNYLSKSRLAALNECDVSTDSTDSNAAHECVPSCMAFIIDEPDKSYAQYMHSRKVYDVIPVNTKFVVLDTNLSVRKAFYALIYNGVRSALLWSSEKEQFCGLFTVTDFINILIHTYKNAPDKKIQNIEDQLIKEWRELLNRQKKLKPLLCVSVNDTLLNATKKLIDGRFHRIPIFDDAGSNAMHFLTHKRILRYLYLVMDQLPTPSFMWSGVRALGVGTYENLLSVDQRTPLIECFQRLTSRDLSALPVLDHRGVVVDIYARFDAIALAADGAYALLDGPLCEILARRKKSKWYKGVITCLETDSLKSVIDKLYFAEVHGLVVVNNERKLRGVITLFDVLKFIIIDQMEFAKF